MINLTEHDVVITTPAGTLSLEPFGLVTRVATIEEYADTIVLNGLEVPVIRRRFSAVEGLPNDYGPHFPIIVSTLVLEAMKAFGMPTSGVYAPDTGPSAIRDRQGRIVAVRRLVTA